MHPPKPTKFTYTLLSSNSINFLDQHPPMLYDYQFILNQHQSQQVSFSFFIALQLPLITYLSPALSKWIFTIYPLQYNPQSSLITYNFYTFILPFIIILIDFNLGQKDIYIIITFHSNHFTLNSLSQCF